MVEGKVPEWETTKGLILVVEFQKRGLPHVHLLIILNRNNPISAQEIEKYATAEIPDSVSHPRDRERVTTYMLHRPCGSINPEAPCCKK